MILIKILLLIICFSVCVHVYAQNTSREHINYSFTEKNTGYSSDTIRGTENNYGFTRKITKFPALLYSQAKSIFSLDNGDVPWLLAGVGITAELIYFDKPFDNSVKDLKSNHRWIKNSSPIITEFGGTYGIYTIAGFAGLSFITGSDKGLETSLYALEAAFSSGIWTRIGKLIAGRERPSASYCRQNYKGGKWSGPITGIKKFGSKNISSYDAFPSGHTAEAFAIATVFAEQYNNNIIVPVLSYSLASLVGITRMIEHTHWASDVFVGGIIGYLCGKSTININRQKSTINKKETQLTLTPSIQNSNYGASLSFCF